MKPLPFLLLTPSLLFGEVELSPTLHLNTVFGSDRGDLAVHGHDPNNQAALQGVDLGFNLTVDDWLAGFANGVAFTDPDGELDAEWEEGFLKLMQLPGGFELRGGRYLNRLGLQNNIHLHGWDFVNANLSTGTFLGEDGLRSDGAELTWRRDFDTGFFALSGSYGRAVSEDHGHEEEEEEEEEDHEHEEEEEFFEGDLLTARAVFAYRGNDFHQHQLGLNYAESDEFDLASADYVYTWRENGLESGGRSLSVGVEYFEREDDSSFMTFVNHRFAEHWSAAVRYEELNRDRFALALTHDFSLTNEMTGHARLQYQYDELEDGHEDTVWLQFRLSYGNAEIR